jgi:NADH dehydrogenase (ubiquinone) Fe-S protein 6
MLRRIQVLKRVVDVVDARAIVVSNVKTFASGAVSSTTKPGPPVQSKRPGKLPSDVAHTAKWLDSTEKPSPMEYSSAVEPIAVHGLERVNCDSPGACKDRFGELLGLGAPNTYYKLADTTPENPVKCKYCGLRFFDASEH